MKRNTKIALILATALGIGTTGVAVAHGGGGWSGGGWGSMMGGGPGYGGRMMGPGQGGPGYGGQMMGPGQAGPGYGGRMMGPGQGGPGYGGRMMGPGQGGPGYGGQMMGPGMMGRMMGRMMGNGMMGFGHGGWGQHQGAGQAARLDWLANQLQLTETQKPLWDDFRSAIQQQFDARRNAFAGKRAEGAAATTPVARMQSRIDHMQARLDGMKKVSAAFAKLYESLTPEQQAKANSLMGNHGGCQGFGPAGS